MLKIFQLIFKSLFDQINKGVKIHLLIILVRFVAGIRIFVFFATLIIVSAIMSAISLFAGLLNIIQQHSISGQVIFNGYLIFSSVVFVFSLFLFLTLMCENIWLKIMKIDHLIKDIRV